MRCAHGSASNGIEAELTGRPKHLWSIYEKMVVNGKEFDEIFDLVGLRAIVDNEHDCWAVLGALHALWHPVQGRFKDYINQPEVQPLPVAAHDGHRPHGKPIEVQIRTQEMHRRAEFGIAAHWGYKEHAIRVGDGLDAAPGRRRAGDRRPRRVPRGPQARPGAGRGLRLHAEGPRDRAGRPNSTPVDFAYAVHTEVGHHCVGAKVNGRLVPLDTRLSSADVVEILTSKAETAGPSRDWMGFVAVHEGAAKIRQWFSRERREDAIETGRDELMRALRRAGIPIQTSMTSARSKSSWPS